MWHTVSYICCCLDISVVGVCLAVKHRLVNKSWLAVKHGLVNKLRLAVKYGLVN
jgi:uncharacterized membrane protein YcgQ (UPF0703/DUF1980 family)